METPIEVILYIEDVDLNIIHLFSVLCKIVILYIEDVDLNSAKVLDLFHSSVILYIEDVDLNATISSASRETCSHPLH